VSKLAGLVWNTMSRSCPVGTTTFWKLVNMWIAGQPSCTPAAIGVSPAS